MWETSQIDACFKESFPKLVGSTVGTTRIYVVDSDSSQNLIIGAGTNDSNLLNTNDGVERPILAFFSS